MPKTSLLQFHLTATVVEQIYNVKRNAIIREIYYQTGAVADVVDDLRVWRDEEQLFPDPGDQSRDGDTAEQGFHVSFLGVKCTVWEPIRKNEKLRITATPTDTEEVYMLLAVLPVDALATKLHKTSEIAIANLIAKRSH